MRSSDRERLIEAYEVRAFRDEVEQPPVIEQKIPEAAHPEPGEMQAAKSRVMGHGEQLVVPDDCQFGDNEMCYPET